MAATVLFPEAMPPVKPRRSMGLAGAGGSGFGGVSAPEPRGFDGVAHQHGDGHGANATGNGRERAGDIHGVGMDVADEDGTLLAKFGQPSGETAQQRFGLRRVGDFVGSNIDDRSSGA